MSELKGMLKTMVIGTQKEERSQVREEGKLVDIRGGGHSLYMSPTYCILYVAVALQLLSPLLRSIRYLKYLRPLHSPSIRCISTKQGT
jgi:hypothetical protein